MNKLYQHKKVGELFVRVTGQVKDGGILKDAFHFVGVPNEDIGGIITGQELAKEYILVSEESEKGSVPDQPERVRETILKSAAAAISGDRERDYGSVRDNFKRIANIWTEIHPTADFTVTDVALFMAAVKLSRLYESPGHIDSWTDLAGYAALGAEVSQ